MDNQTVDDVFHNDYIMTHILRMMDLREQYELQKVCQRLRFLVVTCVWKRDCRDMEMNRSHMASLRDGEFLDLLRLNVRNIRKLTIDADNGADFNMYFPGRYENLSELHINGFRIDAHVLSIVSKCHNLQLLEFNEDIDVTCLPERDLLTFEMLRSLANLRVLICRNLIKTASFEDLYMLASNVNLDCLELYNVRMSSGKWNSERCSGEISGLKTLTLYCTFISFSALDICVRFVQKSPKVQELQISLPFNINKVCFDNLKQLEKMKLKDCQSQQEIWCAMKKNNIKYLEIANGRYQEDNFKITECTPKSCASLQVLKVTQKSNVGSLAFWSTVFHTPSTSFQNLQELTLKNQDVNDAFMQCVSVKCQQLKCLLLDRCKISGRYIKHLTNTQKLTIINNSAAMSWFNLYSILRDLKLLRYLEIDCMLLTRDDMTITENIQHLANSLKILKIQRTEKDDNFWEHILNNCEESFQNVLALHFALFENGAYFDYSFYTTFPQIQTLQIEGKEFIAEDMIPTVKHLVYIDCLGMKWSDFIEILLCTRVEIVELFDMTLDFDNSMETLGNQRNIFKYIRAVTLPKSVFDKSSQFWQQCLEDCPTFRLCCMDHLIYKSHKFVLKRLLEISAVQKRVKAIHANKSLNDIKRYNAKAICTSKIPVYLLNADNKLWNTRYHYFNNVIIIET